ncbi:hypothetical protein ABZ348_30935 [Streptomyces sp. NPDC005963]|uniref:DUF7439 family protein n=1 Tax=Streptomyces sp. NPDC005963 TaxID=3156721 RepID=UPI003409355B
MPRQLRPYAKAAVATLGSLAGLAALVCADSPEVAAAIQVLTALGVYAQPNGAKM